MLTETIRFPYDNLTDLKPGIDALVQAHRADTPVRVETGTIRWRDGSLWLQISLMADVPDVIAGRDALAQAAVETGLSNDFDRARRSVEEVHV
jgi:hypothetical protein